MQMLMMMMAMMSMIVGSIAVGTACVQLTIGCIVLQSQSVKINLIIGFYLFIINLILGFYLFIIYFNL
jgi:hypothetical protein